MGQGTEIGVTTNEDLVVHNAPRGERLIFRIGTSQSWDYLSSCQCTIQSQSLMDGIFQFVYSCCLVLHSSKWSLANVTWLLKAKISFVKGIMVNWSRFVVVYSNNLLEGGALFPFIVPIVVAILPRYCRTVGQVLVDFWNRLKVYYVSPWREQIGWHPSNPCC